MSRQGPSRRFNPLRSLACAGRGLVELLAGQPNARVHLAASVAVLAAAGWLDLPAGQWCWLIAAIVMVWTAEALNTAIEQLADALHPDQHPLIGKAKDISAAAVLLAVLAAVAIGLLVLGPPLADRLAATP